MSKRGKDKEGVYLLGEHEDTYKIIKEGMLLKTKKLKTKTSVKLRRFVLRQGETTGKAYLDYYDGEGLRGSIDLQGSYTVPRPGTAHFEIRCVGRTYFLQTEHSNIPLALNWVKTLQNLDTDPDTKRRQRRAQKRMQVEKSDERRRAAALQAAQRNEGSKARPTSKQLFYYQVGDELLPLTINNKTNRIKVNRRARPDAMAHFEIRPSVSARPKSRPVTAAMRAGKRPPMRPQRAAPPPPTDQPPAVTTSPPAAGRTSTARKLTVVAGRASQAKLSSAAAPAEALSPSAEPPRLLGAGDLLRHSWPGDYRTEVWDTKTCYEAGDMANELVSSSRLFRISDLEWSDVLGEGFFGRVYKATHRRTGEIMVVKELKESDPTARAAFVSEVALLKSFSHPNVLKFIGIFCVDDKLHLVTEYIGGGSLDRILQKKDDYPDISWPTRAGYALDIASGMAYLHSVNVIHRDLKSENCLVRHDNSVVVADFGLARVMEGETLSAHGAQQVPSSDIARRMTMALNFDEDSSEQSFRERTMTVVGTPYFMAPELFKGSTYSPAVDVFSFGIVLCEIISRLEADPDVMPRTMDFGINEKKFRQVAEDCPEDLLSVAFSCCSLTPSERPTFTGAMRALRAVCLRLDVRQTSTASGTPAGDETSRQPNPDDADTTTA